MLILFSLSLNAQTIAVDVGHNLKASGTVSAYGETEFSYNKALSEFVGSALKNSGYTVAVQGFEGDLFDLQKRAMLAGRSDFLISLHHDAIQSQDLRNGYNDEVRGFGVFVSTKNPEYQKSLKCATNIADYLMKAGFTPNYYHNRDIEGERKELLVPRMPVYRYDNLVVLKASKVPSVLIEAGVLTNRAESQWIKTPEVRLAFAASVARGMRACLT